MNKLLADIIDDCSMGSHVVSTVNLAKISKESVGELTRTLADVCIGNYEYITKYDDYVHGLPKETFVCTTIKDIEKCIGNYKNNPRDFIVIVDSLSMLK